MAFEFWDEDLDLQKALACEGVCVCTYMDILCLCNLISQEKMATPIHLTKTLQSFKENRILAELSLFELKNL